MAGIEEKATATLVVALREAGIRDPATTARLNVTVLGKLKPELIVCDIDDLNVDPLETLRQLRFVLPKCLIAVFTGLETEGWGLACHLAGANCLLSKKSTRTELVVGLRDTLIHGCYTDPHLAA